MADWSGSDELREHFLKHGWQMGLGTEAEYDASARRTIELGRRFTYIARATLEYV